MLKQKHLAERQRELVRNHAATVKVRLIFWRERMLFFLLLLFLLKFGSFYAISIGKNVTKVRKGPSQTIHGKMLKRAPLSEFRVRQKNLPITSTTTWNINQCKCNCKGHRRKATRFLASPKEKEKKPKHTHTHTHTLETSGEQMVIYCVFWNWMQTILSKNTF